jgi:hypothetical protein
MNALIHTWFRWAPRGLAIVFALFLSLFALDVFNEHRGVLQTIVALLIHLTPVWIVLAALAVAWRLEAVGGMLFLGLAVWYIVSTINRPISWSLLIAGPAIIIGALFLLSSWFRGRGPKLLSTG